MTAQGFEQLKDEHGHLKNHPWLPPQKPVGAIKRKQSGKSPSSPNSSIEARSPRSVLPPSPLINAAKHNNSESGKVDLLLTRPRESSQLKVLESFSKKLTKSINDGKAEWGDDCGWDNSSGSEDAKLDKEDKLMDENGATVTSVRSFLLNLLEERDCSIKKRLDLYVHQTETGRSVTDAVIQEVCKIRPDIIGISLRDCTQVTDVGLWCIARHTGVLRELNLSGCHSVTNIGLRSLAICCDKMEQLDFTGCTRLTDLDLRVIAGGCWDLRSLSLEGCAHVSDSGIAEVAKMCTGLTYLNISHCERVGEYGDRALIQVGKSCHRLKGLDAFGCSHTQDPGLLAVARGCPKLEKLMLTGCGAITGKSVRALAKGCAALQHLSLSGCSGVGNGDIKELAKGCTGLRQLNIAQCAQVDASGLTALTLGLKNLTDLDVGGCERVNDAALRSLSGMNAHSLNLSGCTAVSEAAVANIAKNCTALSSLNVTGCPLVGRAFMTGLCNDIKLSEPAHAFYGFQPRKDANELLALMEERNLKMSAAVVIQARIRGCLARGRANIVKRNWIIRTQLGRTQAFIRGYFARKWYRSWRAQVREHQASATIQATWRMFCDRRTAQRLSEEKLARLRGQGFATKIKAGWRGHRGRVRVRELRAQEARRLLLEAREQARQELSSISIQNNWRRYFAEKQLRDLRRLRDEMLEQERRRQAAAVLVQSMARIRLEMCGTMVATNFQEATVSAMKARRNRKILEWEIALRVQRAWRGRKATTLVYKLRILREQERQRGAANKIQCFWYVVRARHLTKIQRALFKIRQMQGSAAKAIQRVYRGFKGRLRAKARRSVFKSDCEREAAAMGIQRVFRGHKGRGRFECKFHLRALEDKAHPLKLKIDELSANAVMLSERLRSLVKQVAPLRAEQITFREELFHIRHTKDKYTDSDKINGYRQRFLTKFLWMRLEELQAASAKKLDLVDAEALKLEVKERQNSCLLRQAERELLSLSIGTVEKVKLMRTARLRKKVHTERSASITIQRIFRGWRVRKAMHSWYRDYWIEPQDGATGDVYYVNTWNQEVRWVKPLKISLFEHDEGELSWQEEDFNAGDEMGIGGCRFSRRLRKLTEEASHAAKQEAQLLRYVADVKGEEMLDAAREWTFVSTDSRLETATKCWYRRSTSEYYWGDDPTLCPPERRFSTEEAKFDGDGMAGKRPQVERGPECGFPDRAAGEAWLKSQDLTQLLARSERVCNIGPAGWQQLRSSLTPKETLGSRASNEEPDSAALLTEGTAGSASDEAFMGSAMDRRQDLELVIQERPTEGASIDPMLFTFFHHAETGEAQWCLSPRTALKTPRTSRRETSRARPAARSSGSDWEPIEDGGVIFYFNKRSGVSSWEPPTGWIQEEGSKYGPSGRHEMLAG